MWLGNSLKIGLGLFAAVVITAQMVMAQESGGLGKYVKVKPDVCAIARKGKARYDAGDLSGADDFSGAWMRLAECLKPLRGTWKREGPNALVSTSSGGQRPVSDAVRGLVLGAMNGALAAAATARDPRRYVPVASLLVRGPALREPIARLAQLNDLHLPYNSMSQSGFARILFQLAEIAESSGDYPSRGADARFYRDLAAASMETVLTPVEHGGLATISACGPGGMLRCAWYHAVTNTDKQTIEGDTLNKSLQPLRDMLLIEASGDDHAAITREFDAAVAAGLNQLFLSPGHVRPGDPPNIANFLMTPAAADGSWAYYGFDPTGAGTAQGYILARPGRTCEYHFRDIGLLTKILQLSAEKNLAPEARARAFACGSPLYKMFKVTRLPVTQADMLAHSPQGFCAVGIASRYKSDLDFLQQQFSRCER